ncbi:hypothetical protein ACP70R_002658 [Stipagrostis hirtigluma subsp. patula]
MRWTVVAIGTATTAWLIGALAAAPSFPPSPTSLAVASPSRPSYRASPGARRRRLAGRRIAPPPEPGAVATTAGRASCVLARPIDTLGMPQTAAEEGGASGSRRTRSSSRRRRSESLEPGPAAGRRRKRVTRESSAAAPSADVREEASGDDKVDEEEEELSSAPRSPLCTPYIPREVLGRDSNNMEVYKPVD